MKHLKDWKNWREKRERKEGLLGAVVTGHTGFSELGICLQLEEKACWLVFRHSHPHDYTSMKAHPLSLNPQLDAYLLGSLLPFWAP